MAVRMAIRAAVRKTGREAAGTHRGKCHLQQQEDISMGRGILLWLLGVPIPVIILLALIWR